jgi:phospholipid-binding lipoprotein MlaA
MKNRSFISITILCVLMLTGCAGTQNKHTDPENDPWEGMNRKSFAFNQSMDKVVRPIAVGYDKVMPDPLQRGVSNFFRNLDAPVTFLNLLLQGEFEKSLDTFGRFLLNSTVGLLGFFDLATKAGVPYHDEDLGQTLASWGYENSRYLVIPVFGPSTVRDGIGRYADSYVNPVGRQIWKNGEWAYWIARGIDIRAQYLDRDGELNDAYDPYVLMRDVWLQNRAYQIYDGDPPMADYDLFLDDAFMEGEPPPATPEQPDTPN